MRWENNVYKDGSIENNICTSYRLVENECKDEDLVKKFLLKD